MSELHTAPDHALAAYETLASHYDAFTAHHDYAAWTRDLEALALRHGLTGRTLLDVACGTGKSFLPYLDRGYDVVGCDASPAMLARAADKAGGRVPLHVADMRDLPVLGAFALITLLDDAVNYLHDTDELTATFAGVERNLAPEGVVLFDANTRLMYRTFFASTEVVERDGAVMVWRGHCPSPAPAGVLAEAVLDVFAPDGDGRWQRRPSTHLQRHHSEDAIRAALAAAGLECVAAYGQTPEATFDASLDEARHSKAIFLARRRSADLPRTAATSRREVNPC
jgi:SAM-dependent methyltransferase